MTIDEILELMDDLLDKSVGVPFAQKRSLVDIDKMREYIDGIRYNLPTEIKNAKEMVKDRSAILNEANQKANTIIKRAEERAKILISTDEIMKQVKEKAMEMAAQATQQSNEMVSQATAQANEIMTQAKTMDKEISTALNERIDAMLFDAERALCKSVNELKSTRQAIKSAQKKAKE